MGNFYISYTACDVESAGLHSCGILFLTVFSGKALLKRRGFGGFCLQTWSVFYQLFLEETMNFITLNLKTFEILLVISDQLSFWDEGLNSQDVARIKLLKHKETCSMAILN